MRGLRLPTATAGRKNFGSEYAWHMEAYDRLCVQSHSIRPPERIAGTPICRLSHMERPAKDRRKTGGEPASKRLVIGHPATLPDARFPTDPDSRPMPTGNRHGIQNGFCKQGPGKSRLPMQPFPGPYFHAVNRVHTFGKVSSRSSSAIPISSPNSQSLSRAQRTTTAVREAATDDASDQPEAACSAPS